MDSGHVLVAGGGSGGHVFPALAVVDQLARRNWQVSWLGRKQGMERDLVLARDLSYHGVAAQAVVGRSPAARVRALGTVGVSALRARSLIRRSQIDVVLGTGGYVSAPGVLGGALARRPAVLIEPNAVAGAANRWLSRFATAAAIGVGGAAGQLRCPSAETGVPIRTTFATARTPIESGDRPHLLVLGGSQGARWLNQLVPAAVAMLAAGGLQLRVTHQVGEAWLDEARRAWGRVELASVDLSVVPFIDDVQAAMAAAHLIVSRAGAITLAEICAVGRAALLLPLELAGSHQVANARSLAATGGAIALSGDQATVERLVAELGDLLVDLPQLESMGVALHRLARPDAAAAVADLVEKVVRSC